MFSTHFCCLSRIAAVTFAKTLLSAEFSGNPEYREWLQKRPMKEKSGPKGRSLGLMPKCAAFRQHAGLTKVELATKARISRDTVAKVERQEPVTLEILNKIGKVLETECERPFARDKEIQAL